MRPDNDIKRDVDAELKWNPELDATDIATSVSAGVVALYGFTRSYHEKHQAELSAKRVRGVGAVANDLVVRPSRLQKITDAQIAREGLVALKQELPHSWEGIRLMVRDGRVVLEGVVHWQYVRARAEQALHRVPGILNIRNSIAVEPAILDGDIASAVEAAFERSAVVDSKQIIVDVDGSRVTLSGVVRSWVERNEANHAAWSAPGVTEVIDALLIRH